jgi:hypothetical protein
MLRVTLPSGKVYTFRDYKANSAHALARKTGGQIEKIGNIGGGMVRRPVCIHGDDAMLCERGACDEYVR